MAKQDGENYVRIRIPAAGARRRSKRVARTVARAVKRVSRRAMSASERGVRRLPWYVTCTSLCLNALGLALLLRAKTRKPETWVDRGREMALEAMSRAGDKAQEVRDDLTGRDYAMMGVGGGLGYLLGRIFKRGK